MNARKPDPVVEAVKQEIYKKFMARLLEEYNKYWDDVILYGKDYADEKLNKGTWQDKVLKDLFNGGEEC